MAQTRSLHLSSETLFHYYKNLRMGSSQTIKDIVGDTIVARHRGMWMTAQLMSQWHTMTSLQRQTYSTAVADYSGYECDTTIGHFRIYFDTTNNNGRKPALYDGAGTVLGSARAYVDSVGAIFNHVWDMEIQGLGFNPPPFESGQSAYVVTISERGNGDYGLTTPIDNLSGDNTPSVWTSSVDIDNDFEGSAYSVTGIEALRVTAAHEFHHAIQYGYGWWDDSETYAYELTSTWMESCVYPDIKDNYQYLPSFFSGFHSGVSLYYYNPWYAPGYERFIWAEFLVKRLGTDIMRDTWIHMSTERYIESVRDAIAQHGSMLSDEFAQFAYWNYFTADRADTIKSYSHGYGYPRFVPLRSISFSGVNAMVGILAGPLSTTMPNFIVNHDTLTAIVVNDNIDAALQRSTGTDSISLALSSSSLFTPYQLLSNGLYAGYSAEHTDVWRTFYLQSATHSDIPSTNLAALPNPFNMENANRLILPVPNEQDAVAAVSFVSSSLNSVFMRQFHTSMEFGKRSIAVPTSMVKSKLSSGIYFVIAKVNGNEYKWKVAVIK
jgi:hypothetical protein